MSLARDTVLILTHSADHFTVDRVEQALARRGVASARLLTDRFPEQVRLSAALQPLGDRHWIEDRGPALDASRVRAVWTRRVWMPQLDAALDARYREWSERESLAALYGFLDGLHTARWVNDPVCNQAATKPRQLRLARAAGLRVPRTLLTNDPVAVRRFHAECHGEIVVKMLTSHSLSMDGSVPRMHTREVQQEDLEALDSLRHCPMVFQERIPKERELRVAFVGGRLFAGAVDASRTAGGRDDWRAASPQECSWARAAVPEPVAAGVRTLMGNLGLTSGALDLIRTPDGDHVFLEVNPTGEWGMLERDLDLPISAAFADALLGEAGATA